MGIKDADALSKTIKPFRQEDNRNNWRDNGVACTSATASSPPDNHSSNQRQRQRRPDRAVYVPRGRRSQTAPTPTEEKVQALDNDIADVIPPTSAPLSSSQRTEAAEITGQSVPSVPQSFVHNPNTEPNLNNQATSFVEKEESPPSTTTPPQITNSITNMAATKANCEASKIETALNTSDKDYNEEKEFQRASKEINRRNRRIIKQTFDSNVLEINDTPRQSPPETELKLQEKPNLPQIEATAKAIAPTQAKRSEKSKDKSAVNTETDDWESIFDENGDCLDSKLMDEITASVGKVTVTKPKNEYKSYQEPVNLEGEEFPHVLEVSNFPVEFKTQDLMMIFVEYKESGFDIKWVDDTHALVVFSSSKIAARALTAGHPMIQLKPLTQATAESRARAKKSALFLQPYRQRPETCAALARRLVTGALGVRLSTAREEREIERRVLKEAKERKLLAAKQRDEAWENP